MSHRHSVTEDPVKIVGIAAIAAGVGAMVAMLLTPRNGTQIRSGLKRRAATIKDEVQNKFNGSVEEVGDNTKDTKAYLQATADQAVKSTKQSATKTAGTTKAVRKRVAKTATDAKPARQRTPKAQ